MNKSKTDDETRDRVSTRATTTAAGPHLFELVWSPRKSSWIAWHEMRTPVAHRARQVHPIVLLVDGLRAGNLHPSLATVINRESDLEVEVLARNKRWYRNSRRIIQMLPVLEAEGGINVLGPARRAAAHPNMANPVPIVAALRLVSEVNWHAIKPRTRLR